jgi:predicted transcriptional regulator
MTIVWASRSPVSGQEVAEKLAESRANAYTTILTVLDRLREKGMVRRFREGRIYRYEAAVAEDEYAASLMTQVLDESANRSGALLRFADQLSEEETASLRAALGVIQHPDPGVLP